MVLQGTLSCTPTLPKRILADIRYDEKDHVMTKAASQGHCKLEGSGTHTWYQCVKLLLLLLIEYWFRVTPSQ